MKARYVIVLASLVVLVMSGLAASAWLRRPELLKINPMPGEANVAATSPIRLEFSSMMEPESVRERLKIEPAMEGSFSWDGNIMTFIPDNPWPSGQEIQFVLEGGAKAANWLAFPMRSRTWSFTTSEAYLAYLWPADGPAELYILNPATGEIIQITHGMGILEYSVSTDGIKIYFSSSNDMGGSDLYQIDRMKAAASEGEYISEKLLDCGVAQCRSPSVASDGKYLAYEYLNNTPEGILSPAQVWLLNLSSITAIAVGHEAHETVQPSWSASGWLAYYDRTASLYDAFNPATQEKVQLKNETGQPGNWSADGNYYLAPEITYQPSAGMGETGTSHLLRYSIPTGASEDISKVENVEDVEGTYSPNGRLILFGRKFLDEARWSLGRQIWIMNSDGSDPHPLTDAPDYNHYDFAWSRDGLKVAYVRFNQAKLSDPPELWMMNSDGSDPLELVVGGYAPTWIP